MFRQNAHKWVKKKKNNEVINSSGNNLTGSLRIEKFMKLKNIKLNKHKITSLTIIECSQLTKIDLSELILTSLHLSNNNELVEINCCKNQLTELDISDCPSLTELNCSYNSIKNLILNLCPKITKLNCSNNQLIDLEISNCLKLESLDCSHNRLTSLYLRNRKKLEYLNCSHNQLERLNISNCSKLEKSKVFDHSHNVSNLNIIRKQDDDDDKIKNILMIGRTGSGKSTLSNVISGTDDFEESGYSISMTKNFKKKRFEWKGTVYCVVDTMGVGDTKLTVKQVLLKVAEGIYSMQEGISQVLFVIDGRFKEEEIKTFELFEKLMFNTDLIRYFTIVRSKFSNFRNKGECEKDKDQLKKESQTIARIVELCRDVIYVDNPPTKINNDDDDDEVILMNEKMRKKSRTILLEYLENACKEAPYKLPTWNDIRDKDDIFNTIIEAFEFDLDGEVSCCSIM